MEEQILEKEIETFTKDEAEEIAKENIGLIHHIIGTLNYMMQDYLVMQKQLTHLIKIKKFYFPHMHVIVFEMKFCFI